jgi:hypothetical protein
VIRSEELTRPATFRDPELEAAFRRDGFVVVDFAPPQVVQELLRAYDEFESGIDSGYYPSLMSPDEDYKAKTHFKVVDEVFPLMDALIDGYEPMLGVFMVKHPGPDTEVPPHQDWIVADESVRPTMNAWMPLTPVTAEAGQMKVLPGSHKWLTGLRGSPNFPTQWQGVWERVRDELMVTVPIEVGQAMVYDIRVLHGTPPNRSAQTRVVTSLYAVPQGVPSVHYHRDAEGTVRGYEVPRNFCGTFMIGDVPDGTMFTEIRDYRIEPLSFDELSALHAAERASADLG